MVVYIRIQETVPRPVDSGEEERGFDHRVPEVDDGEARV
jgi:hypothetical protein